jgi:hypothetical protein
MMLAERPAVARVGAAMAVVVAIAGAVGVQFGKRATTETGTSPAQWLSDRSVVNVGGLGWFYEPEWVDATGGYHLGSRPECLPADGRTVDRQEYDFVTARNDGQTRRVLVLIRCGG